ncbi:MAG: penicillin-binding transpeptidase domain-containing protein [bacterium]
MKKNNKENLGFWQERLLLSSYKNRKGFAERVDNRLWGWERVRVRALWGVLVICLSVVTARLVYLQIFEKGQHTLISDSNHLERKREVAPRGIIFDRNGVALVKNIQVEKKGYTREYLMEGDPGHLLGYIAEVLPEELGCEKGVCNELGMWVGRAGVEKAFDQTLRGKDGGQLLELNAKGEEVRELGINEPEKGQDLILSVDSELQKIISEAIGTRKGSAVAIDMQGKVLGMVSEPSFDPNLFTVKPEADKLNQYLSNTEDQVFLNRAIGGAYPPGSVFKLVTAYAGLESGKIKQDTLIEDTGEIKVNEYRYGNWYFDQYGRKEGEINVVKALSRSNDIFFYKVGEEVGVDSLVEWAGRFGLGETTKIELAGEQTGLVPTRLWKERATGEKWFLGNTYHLAIGQGDLLVTPLQVARMTAAAVSGRLCEISLQKESKVQCRDLGIKSQNLEVVRAGMKGVCASGGTAFPFFDFSPYVLCKTGTAQHGGQGVATDLDSEKSVVKPHAWIVVAYPGENPTMILTVMLESAGEGSYEAAPVARQILEKWKELGN